MSYGSSRIEFIDYLRVVVIFLMVFGHSGISSDGTARTLIYGFHMPFFVFLSGYLVKPRYSLSDSLERCFRTLLIPYFFFSIFLIPFNFLIEYLIGNHLSFRVVLGGIFEKLLMIGDNDCGPIWFLVALAIIRLSYDCVSICLNRESGKQRYYAILFILLFITLGVLDIRHIFSVLSFGSAIALCPFFFLGKLCKKDFRISIGATFLIALVLIVGYYFSTINNGYVDFAQLRFGNYVLITYLNAAVGCVSIFYLGKILLSNMHCKLLSRMGEYSIGVLGFHIIFIQLFRFLYKILFSEDIPSWYLLFISFITLLLCCLLTGIVEKINPRLIGKSRC